MFYVPPDWLVGDCFHLLHDDIKRGGDLTMIIILIIRPGLLTGEAITSWQDRVGLMMMMMMGLGIDQNL